MLDLRAGTIRTSVLTAPLAGVADPPFQQILHELHAPLISTEMLPADGLARAGAKVLRNIAIAPDIHPILVQLFGKNPTTMGIAAQIIEERGADIIDLNMGCPAKKVCRTGSGVALMRKWDLARSIMQEVRHAVSSSILSIKIRLGWDPESKNCMDFVRLAEDEGFDFVTVHARYRSSYTEPAQWNEIAEIQANTRLQIVGNGDVFTVGDAHRLLQETNCAAVMIGRGILGNPWFPAQIHNYLESGIDTGDVSCEERMRVMYRHLDLLVDRFGERRAALMFRKHAAWYLKGIPQCTRYRREVFGFTTQEQYKAFCDRLTACELMDDGMEQFPDVLLDQNMQQDWVE